MRCSCVCMLQDWKIQSNCKWTVPFTASYTFCEKKNMLRGRLIVNSYLFDSHASRSFYSHIYILINEPFFEKTLKTLSSIKRVSPCIVSACISVEGCSIASQSCCFEVYCRLIDLLFKDVRQVLIRTEVRTWWWMATPCFFSFYARSNQVVNGGVFSAAWDSALSCIKII